MSNDWLDQLRELRDADEAQRRVKSDALKDLAALKKKEQKKSDCPAA